MSTLSALPEEVLLNIVENLSCEPGTRTICSRYAGLPQPDIHKISCARALYAFALCSRRFHPICQKLLYRSVPVYSTRRILLLARTLLYRHDLAKNVQQLDVYADDDSREINLVKDIEDWFEIALQRLCQSVQTKNGCSEDLRSNSGSAPVALLLLLLPNLKWLDIQFSSDLYHITSLIRALPTKQPSGVASLCDGKSQNDFDLFPRFSVLWLTPGSYIDIDLSSIMKLPTLRSLSLRSFEPMCSPWTINTGCSDIRSLELSSCGLAEDEIFNILRACCELRRFTYHWNQPWSDESIMGDEWDHGIDVASWIIEGLKPSRDKLEVLEMTGSKSLRHDTMSLGSLVAFSCLRSLCVPAVMVLNPIGGSLSQHTLQSLPKTLKHLHLVDAEIAGERTIESKLLDCLCLHDNFPILASLTIDWRLNCLQSDWPNFRRLEESCRDWAIFYKLRLFSIP